MSYFIDTSGTLTLDEIKKRNLLFLKTDFHLELRLKPHGLRLFS